MNGDYKAFYGYIVLSIIAWIYSFVIYRKKQSVLRKKEKVCIIASLLLFAAAIISIVLKLDQGWSFFAGGCILVLANWFNTSIRNKK